MCLKMFSGNITILMILYLLVFSIILNGFNKELWLFRNAVNNKIKTGNEFYLAESIALKLLLKNEPGCSVTMDDPIEALNLVRHESSCNYVSKSMNFKYIVEDIGYIHEKIHRRISLLVGESILQMRIICLNPQGGYLGISREYVIISEKLV